MACKVSFEVSIESTVDLRELASDLRKAQSGRQASQRQVESSPHQRNNHDADIFKIASPSIDVLSNSQRKIDEVEFEETNSAIFKRKGCSEHQHTLVVGLQAQHSSTGTHGS